MCFSVPATAPLDGLSFDSWLEYPKALFLPFDGQFEEFSGCLRVDADLGKFGPLALLIDPQQGTGPDGTQREAPGEAFAILQQLHVRLQEAAVVESNSCLLTFAFYSPIVRAVEETGNGWRAASIAV